MSIIVLGLWGSPVVLILKPDGDYKEIGVFIPWIVSGTLLYYLGGYFAPGPAIKKKTYWKLIAFVLAASSNALLNYTLIPRLGILGAGIATTTSSLLAGIFNQVISNRLFFVPNRWKFSFAMILLFTTIVSFSQHERFVYNINEFSFIWRVIVSVVMIILGSLPFYKDIKATGLLNKFAAKLL
jgi:O-antigen/teichoic acid export membrane protein